MSSVSIRFLIAAPASERESLRKFLDTSRFHDLPMREVGTVGEAVACIASDDFVEVLLLSDRITEHDLATTIRRLRGGTTRPSLPVLVVHDASRLDRGHKRELFRLGSVELLRRDTLSSGMLEEAVENLTLRCEVMGLAPTGVSSPGRLGERTEAELAAVIHGLPIGIGVTDERGRILSMNPAALTMHGYSSVDQINALEHYEDGFELRYPDGTSIPREDWPVARALRGEYVTDFEVRLRRLPNGEERHVIYTVVPARDEPSGRALVTYLFHDVTDARRAEAKLQASEIRYRTLFEAVEQGFCIVEVLFDETDRAVDWLFLEANPAFERHTGLREVVGKRVRELLPSLDDSWFNLYGGVAKTGKPARYEGYAEPLDRWFEVQAIRIEDVSAGKVVVLFTDISDRKRAEVALRESEARARRSAYEANLERNLLDAILDAAPTGIVVANATGELIRVNRASDQIWGGSPVTREIEEYRQWKAWWANGSERRGKLVEPGEWAVVRALEGILVEGDVVEIEPFDAPGERRTVMITAAPVRDRDAKVVGAVVAQTDVTDLLAAEAAVRRSEERYRLVARATNDIIWDWDFQTNTLSWNEAVRTHVGCAPEELGTSLEAWSERIHPEDRDRVNASLMAAIESDAAVWSDEYRFRREDGTYATFLDRGYMARDEKGKVYRAIGSMLNLTEQREAERALREADRRKDEFLAVLAHELRNPLAPVRTAVQLLRQVGSSDPLVERTRDIIDRQVTHMAKLIDDLLDVSRITRGKLELRVQRCDLAALVRQTAEDYRANLEASGLRLDVAMSEGELWVDGDPTRIVQMIGNLLHNATRFAAAGGKVSVCVAEHPSRNEAVIVVQDDGVGIAPELMGRIFDAFSQAEQGLARSKGGLGLGLALTKGLAELHGGTVTAESAGLGKGAKFTIHIPLAEHPAEHEGNGKGGPTRPLKVVVVEDNQDSADLLATLLELSGHEVKIAYDGRSGIDVIESFAPEVVISDIGLPGEIDGYAVARAVRETTTSDRPLLIALSGYAQDEDRRRSRQAGFDTHLAKPPDLEKLRAILDEATRREFTRST